MNHYSPSSSQPPSGMADVLNPCEDKRDSAYFSSTGSNGDASKHASIVSNHHSRFTPPSYSSSVADKTPSPTVGHPMPHSLMSPTSGGMTVASMVSPTTPGPAGSVDAHMLARLDSRASGDQSQRASAQSFNGPTQMLGRRDSIESRMNNGFEGLRLQANSPYASHNPSTTSITASLQRERNPGNDLGRIPGRFPSAAFPNGSTYGDQHNKRARIAPAITGPADSTVAHGAVPVQGQAWAFPDDDVPVTRRSGPPAESQQTSYLGSRRSSVADSIASSQYTTESRLPPGQRRLEDGYPADYPNRLSRASSEFQPSHHHHSLQHKNVGDLRDEEGTSPGGSQPYSRTPELRVSHKLAERKRRNEMKELYDELRDLMPQERGSKASKWEILSKAITEHKRQSELIVSWKDQANRLQLELNAVRQEANDLRAEFRQLRAEINHGPGHPGQQHIVHHMPPTPMETYPTEHYSRQLPIRSEPRAELPPLRAINGPMAVPESMTGLQYQHAPPLVNGFR